MSKQFADYPETELVDLYDHDPNEYGGEDEVLDTCDCKLCLCDTQTRYGRTCLACAVGAHSEARV